MEPVSPSPGTRTVAPEPGAPGAHPSSWGIGGLHLWPGNTEYLGVSCRPTPAPNLSSYTVKDRRDSSQEHTFQQTFGRLTGSYKTHSLRIRHQFNREHGKKK